MIDFSAREVKIELGDSAYIVATETDYDTQIELLEASGAAGIIAFLKKHLKELHGFTVNGKEPEIEQLGSWPIELINTVMEGYTAGFQKLAGATEEKVAKKN